MEHDIRILMDSPGVQEYWHARSFTYSKRLQHWVAETIEAVDAP